MPSIRDFSGGVLNQELQNRDNGNGILFDCKNVLSSWNGELRKRTGTAWLASLPSYQRIIPYRLPNGNDIILLLSDNKIYGYEFSGEQSIKPFYIFTGDGPTFPTTGWAGNTTNGNYTIWLSSDSEDTTWGAGFDTPVKTTPMTYYGKGALWTGGYGASTNIPAYIKISSTSPQLLNSLKIRWTYTAPGNVSGQYKGWIEPTLQYSDDGTNWTSIKTQMSNPVPFGGTSYYSGSYHYGIGVSEKTENHIVYTVTNVEHVTPHLYWRVYCARRIVNTNTYAGERIDLNVSDITYLSNNKTPLVIDTSSDFQINEENADNIKFAQSAKENIMILVNGHDKIYYLQYSSGQMQHGEFIASFPDGSNEGKPSCVCFYQNRLWFGGFEVNPNRVRGSAFGNIHDFTIPPSDIQPTNAISCDSIEIKSRIENMWGADNALYCLSEDGVSMIDAQGGIVATDNVEFKLRNREPVNNMTPTYKDDIMLYLGRDKKKILMTDYDFVVQRFKAQNISENYTDFLFSGVRELHYIPDRQALIYGLLQDGEWFTLLLDVMKGKNALFPLTTKGKIFDIQPVKYGEQTRLVLVTQRDGEFMLEEKTFSVDQRIMDFMTKAEKEAYTHDIVSKDNAYLDCMVKKSYDEPTDLITNIPYSSDAKVDVIADGIYLGQKDLSPAIAAGIYAWENDGNFVYTSSTTPSVYDPILNDDGSIKEGYDLVNSDNNNISVEYDKTSTVQFKCWTYTSSVVTDSVGTLSRNPAGDGIHVLGRVTEVQVYGFGWGGYWNTSPAEPVAQRGVVYSGKTVAGTIQSYNSTHIYIESATPSVGDTVYDEDNEVLGTISSIGTTPIGNVSDSLTAQYIEVSGTKYYRNLEGDREGEITEHVTEQFYRNSSEDIMAQGVSLTLDEPANEVILGYTYDSYAVLKFVSPYNMRKFPKEISVNFINTGYLEVGNTFDSLKSVLNNLVESVTIDNKKILMNGNYVKTLDKQTFETPYVIVRSDKGLPFIITGIDYKVDMSNYQGGV